MKKYSANCPISHRYDKGRIKNKRMILDYIFPGYQTCNSSIDLVDASTQTVCLSDWEDTNVDGIIEKTVSKTSREKTAEFEEYTDVMESGDEEFLSVCDERFEETNPDMPNSINIQLKESPHIIVDEGTHKTKISLTSNYLEKNGLKLLIDQGSHLRLKVGKEDIYPTDKPLPADIKITVTDQEESKSDKTVSRKRSKTEEEFDKSEDDVTDIDFQSSKVRIGVLSLAVDELEQRSKLKYLPDQMELAYPGSNVITCIPDEYYTQPIAPRDMVTGREGMIQKANAEYRERLINGTKPTKTKGGNADDYDKVKKNFFYTAFEGDPAIDIIKKGVIEDLTKHGYRQPVSEELIKSIEVQTEVHINPNTTSEDWTLTEDSDSLLKRFNKLRGTDSLPSTSNCECLPTDYRLNENSIGKINTHDATIGQIESDFSTKTDPTMAGIPELTEKKTAIEGGGDPELINENESNITEDDVSEISNKTIEKTLSIINIEKRSKVTDTNDLHTQKTNDVATLSERAINSPSLLQALQTFEKELSPLQSELSRLHSEFKSIDIPEELRSSVPDRMQDPYPPPPATYPYSTFHRTQNGAPSSSQDLYTHCVPCSCPAGTCLGFRRSSGIECQRIKRLPPQASSSEFYREFTRPAWIRNNVYNPESMWSEPEDILGNSDQQPSASRNNVNDDKSNKSEKF